MALVIIQLRALRILIRTDLLKNFARNIDLGIIPFKVHEFLINILAYIAVEDHNTSMRTMNYEKLVSSLESGRVYRREALLPFSPALDRDLATSVDKGVLEKVAPGLYYKPAQSRFGALPASDKELVRNFLRDDLFLIYSWDVYNGLGLGLTQLYNRQVVYNRKRHGLFRLGGKLFDFHRPARGFPEKFSKEFLLVDLVNNLSQLAEDAELTKARIKKNLLQFDQTKLNENVKRYGKVATIKFFEESSY